MQIVNYGNYKSVYMEDDERFPLSNVHPGPWQIQCCPRFTGWDPRSSPRVVDKHGVTVFVPVQTVGHPGVYDHIATQLCEMVVAANNQTAE